MRNASLSRFRGDLFKIAGFMVFVIAFVAACSTSPPVACVADQAFIGTETHPRFDGVYRHVDEDGDQVFFSFYPDGMVLGGDSSYPSSRTPTSVAALHNYWHDFVADEDPRNVINRYDGIVRARGSPTLARTLIGSKIDPVATGSYDVGGGIKFSTYSPNFGDSRTSTDRSYVGKLKDGKLFLTRRPITIQGKRLITDRDKPYEFCPV